MTRMVNGSDGHKGRLTAPEPNDTSVVLLIEVADTIVLLGGDLEQQGWLAILDGDRQVDTRASAFKVPHHGSEDAFEERVWTEMLSDEAGCHSDPVVERWPFPAHPGRCRSNAEIHE